MLNAVLGDEMGHVLTFAPDGAAAVERYRKSSADVVLTDLVMPNMNGIVMIQELLSIDPVARIVAMSGKSPEHLERAREAGAVAVLPKPLRRSALTAAIKEALAGGTNPWGTAR